MILKFRIDVAWNYFIILIMLWKVLTRGVFVWVSVYTILIMAAGLWCSLAWFIFWCFWVDDGCVSLLKYFLNKSISTPLILLWHTLLFHYNTHILLLLHTYNIIAKPMIQSGPLKLQSVMNRNISRTRLYYSYTYIEGNTLQWSAGSCSCLYFSGPELISTPAWTSVGNLRLIWWTALSTTIIKNTN